MARTGESSSWTLSGPACLVRVDRAYLVIVLCAALTACVACNQVLSPEKEPSVESTVTPLLAATKDLRCEECLQLHAAQRTAIASSGTASPTATSFPEPGPSSTNDPPPELAQDQFGWAVRNHQPAIVLFWEPQCDSCEAMRSLLESTRDGLFQVLFLEIRVDQPGGADLARQAGAESVPAWFFITDKGNVTLATGGLSEEQLRLELERLLP